MLVEMSGINSRRELRLRLEGCSTGEESEDESQVSLNLSDTLAFSDTRTHVVVELYDNERTYVESLQILVTVSFHYQSRTISLFFLVEIFGTPKKS
jgi:hypothetical protein